MKGYIKLYRELKDHPIWFQEKFTRGQAWVDLLLLANYKEGIVRKRGVRIDLEAGQLSWSMNSFAERFASLSL